MLVPLLVKQTIKIREQPEKKTRGKIKKRTSFFLRRGVLLVIPSLTLVACLGRDDGYNC